MPQDANTNISLNSVDAYERLELIHEGTYGRVFRARHIESGRIVALKRFKMLREVAKNDAYTRELAVLGALDHPHVVRLFNVVHGATAAKVYAVLEYAPVDLRTKCGRVSEAETKRLSVQLLQALDYLHGQHVIHRDLSTSNLLVSADGQLKVADFGLARFVSSTTSLMMTPSVVTLRYRAPELLLGCTDYTASIDMWSAGCVIFELMTGEPLFSGDSELVHLVEIFQTIGPPSDTDNPWPSLSRLPNGDAIKIPAASSVDPAKHLRSRLFNQRQRHGHGHDVDSWSDFLLGMLQYEPSRRKSARQALAHDIFV